METEKPIRRCYLCGAATIEESMGACVAGDVLMVIHNLPGTGIREKCWKCAAAVDVPALWIESFKTS